MTRVAIIGSGIAGLACARALRDAGVSPVVFDKGRGPGGRVATRRADGGYQFDHGAQHIAASNDEFAAVLKEAEKLGFVAQWHLSEPKVRYVGVPGMTGFAKFLGQGLDIRQQTEVSVVEPTDDGWQLSSAMDLGQFDRVICTAPAPQSAALVGAYLQQAAGPETALYAPCLTLMVALRRSIDLPDTQKQPTKSLAWIAHDSAKPGRPVAQCWVIQADAAWSATHIELTKDEIGTLMLDEFLTHARTATSNIAHMAAHRWRYAMVTTPLGVPFLKSPDGHLYAGGDWCLGSKIEDAWRSGTSIAREVLKSL